MRKIALLIVLMMVFALTSYAADIAVSVSGKSVLTFGVNLNDPVASGFTNTNESKITFDLVSGSSEKGKAEDGAVYGYIKVSGWKINLDGAVTWAGKNGDVEAKIIFPGGWVKISGTNNSLNFVNIVQNDGAVKDTDDKGLNDSVASSGGFVVGLAFAPVNVELAIFSANDWTGYNADPLLDTLNDEHAYGANLKLALDVKPVKVEAGVEMAINSADTGIGAGAKISADIAPITAYVSLDATMDSAEVLGVAISTTGIEMGFGLGLAVAGIKVTADGSYNMATVAVEGIDPVTSTTDGMDVRAKIDAGGLVAGLGLALTVELFNLDGIVGADTDADAEYAIIVDASFKTATIKPYASFRYGTYDVTDNAYTYLAAGEEDVALTIGAEMYLIPNVTFDAKYTSGQLGGAAVDNGIITFATTIAL